MKPSAVLLSTIALVASPLTAAPAKLQLDTANTGATINPFIYGQFIEHLGRCIYGGIWAEMLEDRKFYFPITGVAAIIFALMALGHLARLIIQPAILVAGHAMPLWPSVPVCILLGGLSAWMWSLSRPRPTIPR